MSPEAKNDTRAAEYGDLFFADADIKTCLPAQADEVYIHLNYRICYVLEGSGVFTVNHTEFCLGAGQGILITPNDVDYGEAANTDPWRYLWIAFNGNRAGHYLEYCKLSREHPVFVTTHGDVLEEKVREMARYKNHSAPGRLYLTGLLYQVLSILAEDADLPYNYKVAENPYVIQTIRYIQDHYKGNIQITDIAASLSVHRCYLSMVFKKTLGLSPQQFLMTFRIKKAEQLLQNTHYSINEIAKSCGYTDADSFCKAFKKINGINPSTYRREDEE